MGGDGRDMPGHTSNIFCWLKPNRFPLVCLVEEEGTRGTQEQKHKGAEPQRSNRPGMKKVWAFCQRQGLGQRCKG